MTSSMLFGLGLRFMGIFMIYALANTTAEPATAQTPPVLFENAAAEIPFLHRSWEFGGDGLTGAAWFDYDRDGDQDLYMSNGQTQPASFFRNNGDGTFTDATHTAGLSNSNGNGSGAAVAADLDNDGYQELLVTGEGGLFQQPIADAPVLQLYANRDHPPSQAWLGQIQRLMTSQCSFPTDGPQSV